ncbi:uncharacterized protein LOC104902689 isoform X2 [Beta vulgaris subsp. vulgaris]|uniref:uncharacterized protein LOC104902689 isoform X2 n=1 Tax=Beta vulgaris subsp. vulgaris TaxID=3555 RepID=UPI002036AE28|nr:uncharacterized protein LOC104902689 isoform X2 [Beta vulgaris subsp. vulgaris]
MAAESNTSFHQEDTLGAGLHRHAISFQSGAVNSTSEMIPIGNYYGMNSSNGNLMFCDNSSIISTSSPCTTPAGSSSGSLLLDSVPGLKHDAGLAVEWTEDEQYKLEEGLVKYKEEPSIMRYIKIAALLRDKTVRDVALRCRWMTRKRRKQEESHLGRKGNYRKDKYVESSSKCNLPSASIPNMNMAPYSHQPNQMDHNQRVKCQVLTSKAKHLLEQNVQALNQIDSNMSLLKLQDNIDLFCRTRDNISNIHALLNDMKELSGKIGQMQELPISIDQNLASSILPLDNDVWHA